MTMLRGEVVVVVRGESRLIFSAEEDCGTTAHCDTVKH
jgi:hypothetical protein